MLSLSPGAARADVSPLPASNYSVRAACATPVAGRAGCLAVQLIPMTPAARAHTHPLLLRAARELRPASAAAEGAFGLRPQDLHSAYDLPATTSVAQTVAVVDAYDDPSAEHDLAVYDREFGLPECTTANGCFTKVNQNGQSAPLPTVSGEWAMETALDVETAHAICENCHILLVEADSNSNGALEAAENRAVLAGASEISNSWGTVEPIVDGAAFNHPGVVITAAAGDSGYLNWNAWSPSERGAVLYPAASPHVVAVGATRLALKPGGEWAGESVWNNTDGASGGGCSAHFGAPRWQQTLPNWVSVGCGAARAVADVSAVGDPYTGAAIYDSTPWGGYVLGWLPVGGTSLASPLIAAAFALAGGAHGQPYPALTLYESERGAAASLHAIASGSNGECWAPSSASGESGCSSSQEAATCSFHAICLAGTGYSGAAGVGTPDGLAAFQPGSFPLAGSGTSGTGAVGGSHGTDAGGGPGAAAASEAGSDSPPASGQAPSSNTGSHHAVGRERVVRLSRLRLTAHALAALHRSHATVTKLAFSFSLSTTVPVRVTLHRLTSTSAHQAAVAGARATVLASSFQLVAHQGRNEWHLRGAGTLSSGRYRLTLMPNTGAARSLTIAVR